MVQSGFDFENLHWHLSPEFEVNERKWMVIQECTSLTVEFDPLSNPLNPHTLRLPKLRTLWASQNDREDTIF